MPLLKENINVGFANYIESRGQFSCGLMKFAFVKTFEEIFNLPRDTIPCFSHSCITVLQSEMTGGTRFCDMRVHDVPGRAKLLAIMFLSRAFCNPKIGSVEELRSFAANPIALHTYTANMGTMSRTFSKVYISVEPLFHKHTSSTTRQPLDLEEIFDPLNVRGYRMWFFFADPNICPIKALLTLIQEQNSEMGTGPTSHTPVPEMYTGVAMNRATSILENSDSFLQLSGADQADRITSQTDRILEQQLPKISARVDRSNVQKQLAQAKFAKTLTTTCPVQLLRFEITSVVDIVNQLTVQEGRCINETCSKSLCERCQCLPTFEELYDAALHAESPRLNCQSAVYKNVQEQSLLYVHLNNLLHDQRASAVKDLIDPTYHFSMENHATRLRCMQPGIEIHPQQLDPSSYQYIDRDTNLIYFTMPLPQYVFNYTPEKILHPEFMQLEFPWCIKYADFYLSLLEARVQEQNKQRQRELNSHIFSSIAGGRNNQALRQISLLHRRWRSVLPTNVISVGEEFNPTDPTRKIMIASRKQQEEADNRVIKVIDDFNRARMEDHDNIRRLQDIAQSLCKEDQASILRVIRAQGMRKFKSTFTTAGKVTRIVSHAASHLDNLQRSGKKIFYEIPPITKNLPGPFANYMIRQFAHAEARGVLHLHDLFIMTRQYAMRALHNADTDILYGGTSLIPHLIVFGYAGQGKSYTIDQVASHTGPYTINMESSASARSANTPECQDDKVVVCDEFRPGIDPTQPNPSPADIAATSNAKERMTSFRSNHWVTELGDSNMGKSSVRDRKTLCIETMAHFLSWLNGNDMRLLNDKETSWLTRFRMYFVLAAKPRLGAQDLSGQAIRYGVGRIDTIINDNTASFKNWCKIEYSLHVAVAKAIMCGALPYPCLDIVAAIWSLVYPRLVAKYPFIKKNPRAIERISSDALTFTINMAIYMVFNSMVSPIHNIDADKLTINDLPYSHDLLNLLQPYLGGSEEIAIYTITYGILTEMFPRVVWEAARNIARVFAGNESSNPKFVQKVDVEAAQYVENQNYVDCGEVSKILQWMTSDLGHNEYTAIAMITRLKAMTMICDWKTPGRPDYPTEKKEIHVAITVEQANKFSSNDEVRLKESSLYISRQFIKDASPENLIEFVMSAICHKNIRPREVLIGCTHPGMPFLPMTYKLEPKGSHMVNTAQMQTNREYIEAALLGSNSITVEAVQRRKAIRESNVARYQINDDTDIESLMIRNWLETNAYLGPGISPDQYLPANVEQSLKDVHVLFNMEGTVNYPQDPINEYLSLGASQGLHATDDDALPFDYDEEVHSAELNDAPDTEEQSALLSASLQLAVRKRPVTVRPEDEENDDGGVDLSAFVQRKPTSSRPTNQYTRQRLE